MSIGNSGQIPDKSPFVGEPGGPSLEINKQKAVERDVSVSVNPVKSRAASVHIAPLQVNLVASENLMDLNALENEVENLGQEIDHLQKAIEQPPPSLDATLNRWGNEELSLMFHEYQHAKKILGAVWSTTEIIDVRAKVESKMVAPVLILAEGVPKFDATALAIDQALAGITLAYKIPSYLGKSSVLIYKKTLISRMDTLLKTNPEGITKEQKKELQAWIEAEKKEISAAAKEIVKNFGTQLPGNLLAAIRVCQFSVPLLHLGLMWVAALLGPALGCYRLHKATNQCINVEKDIAAFNKENIRQTPTLPDTEAKNLTPEQIEKRVKALVLEQTKGIHEARKSALLEKREKFEGSFNNMLTPFFENYNLDHLGYLVGDVATFSADVTTLEQLSDKLEGMSFHTAMSKAIKAGKMDQETLGQLESMGVKVTEEITKEQMVKLRDLLDGALARQSLADGNMALAREFFEERGLGLDPKIKTAEALLGKLGDDSFKESMLARYIDVNSQQQMADTVTSGLKSLAMKKQSVARRGALHELTNSKLMLAVASLGCILTVSLTLVAMAGVVTVPLLAFFVPAFGMVGMSVLLLSVGLIRLRKNSPNLFSEITKVSVIKVALYGIPKSINEFRQSKLLVKRMKNSMATQFISAKTGELSLEDQKKLQDLARESGELSERAEKLEGKIKHWEEKIKPIGKGIMIAKWKDFLQQQPQKNGMSDQDVMQTIGALKQGLLAGETYFDEGVRTMLQQRYGIDINSLKDPQVIAALLAFAP